MARRLLLRSLLGRLLGASHFEKLESNLPASAHPVLPGEASQDLQVIMRRIEEVVGSIQKPVAQPVLAKSPFPARPDESYDIMDVAFLNAAFETARYLELHFAGAKAYTAHRDIVEHSIRLSQPGGLHLEFGVGRGTSLRLIADFDPRPVFGFDSFDGLPEDWFPGYGKGAFACAPPDLPDNVTTVQGLFADTLPGFLDQHPGPVTFLHIDCDLYSSTKTVLDLLGERIKPGCVILFDEYWNYPGWRNHEYRAFQEFVEERRLRYRYAAFRRVGAQACVVIES